MTHNDALVAFLGPEIFMRLEWGATYPMNNVTRFSLFSRVGI